MIMSRIIITLKVMVIKITLMIAITVFLTACQ